MRGHSLGMEKEQLFMDKAKIEEKISMYSDAIDALVIGGVQSYSLPTGVSVTKNNLAELETLLDKYEKKLQRKQHGMVGLFDHSRET